MGHHADDVLLWHADVAPQFRPHRFHRNVSLDRSRSEGLRSTADEPHLSNARERSHQTGSPSATRCSDGGVRLEASWLARTRKARSGNTLTWKAAPGAARPWEISTAWLNAAPADAATIRIPLLISARRRIRT